MIHKYLAYLKTIETGSITQAAAELGYTQSAVSRMIADLESIGTSRCSRAIARASRSARRGRSCCPSFNPSSRGRRSSIFAVGELHGLQSGLIRVGAFTSMATGWMPLMIKSFHEKYPNIRFQIFNGEYNQIATWLRRGQIDCGFLALPCAKEFDDLPAARLADGHPAAEPPAARRGMLPRQSAVGRGFHQPQGGAGLRDQFVPRASQAVPAHQV